MNAQAVARFRVPLDLTETERDWLDEIAERHAKDGERPNRAATVRRLIRQERERVQKEEPR